MLCLKLGRVVALGLSLSVGSVVSGGQTGRVSQRIDVVAHDYAFSPFPAHIRAGPTIFTFANKGTVRHELSLVRLKAGSTIEDVVKVSKGEGKMRDYVERSVGILLAAPGNSPDGRLLVDLLPGQTYVVLCTLKDKPDSPAHVTMGMYTTFRPR
jgi:plastocyanin